MNIDNQGITNDSRIKDPQVKKSRSGSAARRMLTVAAELDLVTRLFAVIAAVLPVRSLRLDGTIAGRVSALGRSSHVDPPFMRIYAS